MKNPVFFALFALVLAFSSCTTPADDFTNYSDDVFEVKAILDQAAEDHRAPELKMSLETIDAAIKGEYAFRMSCEDVVLKRHKQATADTESETEYRMNTGILLGHVLANYGSEMLPGDPIDFNGDGFMNSSDLLASLAFFGNDFETFDVEEQFVYVGGEVSGSGLLTEFTGDLVIDGDTVELVSLFPGSNSFINHTDTDEVDGAECYNSNRITFVTDIGVVKFWSIN